jgi:hypothetical protein
MRRTVADDGGEVQIRLSQEGGAEVVTALQQIIAKLDEMSTASKTSAEKTDQISESLKGVVDTGAATAFATTAMAVMQFGTMVADAAEKLFHYAEALVSIRGEHEQFEIRLASLNEKTLGWDAALAQGVENLDALEKMSANVGTQNLVNVFQRLTLMVGGTDSQLRDLTQRMELFGQKSGVTAEQLLRVIQMAERTGTLPMRGQMAVASMAMQDAGITGADIKAAAMEGTLMTLLDKLHLSAEATAALENSWMNLGAGLDRAKDSMLSIIGSAFDPMKKAISDMTATLWSPAFQEVLAGWVLALKQVSQEIVDVLFPALKNLGGALMNAFGDPNTITVIKGLVDVLAILVNVVAGVVDALGGLAVPLAVGVIAFKAITASIGVESLLAANAAFGEMAVVIGTVEMSAAPLLLALGGIAVALGAVGAAAVYYGLLVPEQNKVRVATDGLTESTDMLGKKLLALGPQSKQFLENWAAFLKAQATMAALPKGGYEEGTWMPGASAAEIKKAQAELDAATEAMNKAETAVMFPTKTVDPLHKGIKPDLKLQTDAAVEALQALYDKMDEKHDLVGLDAMSKKMAEIQNAADNADAAMTKAYNSAVDKNWKPTSAESKAFDTRQAQLQIDAGIEQQQLGEAAFEKVQKDYEKAYEARQKAVLSLDDQYTKEMEALENHSADTKLETIAQGYKKQEDALTEHAKKVIEKIQLDADAQAKAYQAAMASTSTLEGLGLVPQGTTDALAAEAEASAQKSADRIKAIQTALGIDIVAIEKQKDLAIQTERDLEAGNWDAYYADLLKKAQDAGDKSFATVQATGQKVAADAEKNAQTFAEGWDAGLRKISSSIKSFGQDTATLMTAVWASMTTAFDTGFYDILTGKFSDLGNVLKSLWDSILKDFSKMLTQMLERWLITGDAMGNGQGTGGVLGGLSNLFGGGSKGNAAATQGWGSVGYGGAGGDATGAYQTTGNASWLSGGQSTSNDSTTTAELGYAAAAVVAIATVLKDAKQTTGNASYQGVGLGQQNYGGQANFGADVTPFITVALATAGASGWTGVGLVAAIVIAIVGVIVAGIESLINGPAEGHVKIAIADALSGAAGPIGTFVNGIFDATTNYVGQLALKAAGPEGVSGYVTAYKKAFADALGHATFDIHAGSAADMQTDIKTFFETVLPKLALEAAFGQIGYGPPGSSNMVGGAAGLNWNTNNGTMDAAGNWIKKQLYDPSAPIPMMLTGLGFTADSITAIAQKLADSTDLKAFSTWLQDLIGVVVDLTDLAKQFGRSRDEWFAFIHQTQADVGTAAQFTEATAHLKAGGDLLSTIFGDDRVAAAKALVTEGQTLLNSEGQALANLLSLIDQIAATTASTTQKYQTGQMTPAERETWLRNDATAGYAAIGAAMNPKDVSAAWTRVLNDMTALLDIIAARIANIKALQQSYADFRTQMATDAGPQFGTDPTAWLADNQSKIDAVTKTLATATGDDAIAQAKTLLGLVQDRYNNEIAMLQRVKAAIEAVDAQVGAAVNTLQLQAIGNVVTDPKTGAKSWVPDTHAQGDAMWAQVTALEGQLKTAATPEAAQRIWSQITGLLNQLAAQPQDPAHYAESRTILEKAWTDAGKIFDDQMLKVQHTIETDLAGIGTQLKAGEAALKIALDAAQWDFTQALHNLDLASTEATTKLNGFADALVTQMGLLVIAINGWIALFTNPPPVVTPTTGASQDVYEDDPNDPLWEICISGPHVGHRRLKAGKGTTSNSTATTPSSYTPDSKTSTLPPANVTVTVNSGSAEEIAQAAAEQAKVAVYLQTLAILKSSNTELVRQLRNNPQVLVRTS